MPWDEVTARYRRSEKGRETARAQSRRYYHTVLKFNTKDRERRRKANADNHYKQYGLTRAAALEMKSHGCALCGSRSGKMNIDHCHATGRVRGVLCNPCNLMVGWIERARSFGDKLDRYLEVPRAVAGSSE